MTKLTLISSSNEKFISNQIKSNYTIKMICRERNTFRRIWSNRLHSIIIYRHLAHSFGFDQSIVSWLIDENSNFLMIKSNPFSDEIFFVWNKNHTNTKKRARVCAVRTHFEIVLSEMFEGNEKLWATTRSAIRNRELKFQVQSRMSLMWCVTIQFEI